MIASDEFQSEIDTVKKSYSSVFDIEAFAEGNTIVYQYTYVNQLSDSQVENAKETISEDTLRNAAKTVIQSMSSYFDEPDLAVSYRYYNKDGSLIKQCDFARSEFE